MTRGLFICLGFVVSGFAASASQPIVLSPEQAAQQGPALVEEMLSRQPAQAVTNVGVLKITRPNQQTAEVPVQFEVIPGDTGWTSVYRAHRRGQEQPIVLTITHSPGRENGMHYVLREDGREQKLSGNSTMIPFAGSDFWIADLGLQFLHWPEQRLLRKEIRRGQSCSVLESLNPQPVAGAYSRVLSWIDMDTLGIINAEAYDASGRRLKEFAARKFRKVEGQWHLELMEMSNRQTGSRTQIQFQVGSKQRDR
jgi:hypothetical protein